MLRRDVENLLRQRDHARDRNIAFEIAAERRHDQPRSTGMPAALYIVDDGVLPGELLRRGAVLIADGEFLRGAKLDGAGIGEPVGMLERALETLSR